MTNTNKKLGLHVLNFKLSYNFSLSVRHKQGRYCNTKFVSVFCKKTPDSKEFCDMAGNNTEEVEGSTNTDSKTNTTAELPPEFLIKHPLQNIWSLWFYDNDRTKTWEENLIELTTFDTVEDFWRLYHHIKLPSELRQGHDYAVFKQGIRPMWEDDANKMGGRWLISLEKKQRNSDLDRFWLDVVLLLIGENFEHSEEICGAVVNVRAKLDKIGVWTADTSKQQANLEIGRKIKEQLGIHGKIGFQLHRDTMVKHSSATKNLYTV